MKKKIILIIISILFIYIFYYNIFMFIFSNNILYYYEFRKHQVYTNIYLIIKDYDEKKINSYINNLLDYLFHDKSLIKENFNEKEKKHVDDIKNILRITKKINIISIFFLSLLIIIYLIIYKDKIYFLNKIISLLLLFNMFFIVLSFISIIFFNIFFIIFHKLLFVDNSWIFYSLKDLIVNILPKEIFLDYLFYFFLILIILEVFMFIFFRKIIRNLINNNKNSALFII